MKFKGTGGDDTLTGTDSGDSFDLSQGGNDTAYGLGGNDVFTFGDAFTAADSIDGGDGKDILELNGDYSAGVVFGAATMVNIEEIDLVNGHTYSLTLDDANVAAGQTLSVVMLSGGSPSSLLFDGSRETDGNFIVDGTGGNDVVKTGAGDDTVYLVALSDGGSDFVDAGAGNDTVEIGNSNLDGHGDVFTQGTLNGGAGKDTLWLASFGVTFAMPEFSAASSGFEKFVQGTTYGIFGDDNANNFDFSGFSIDPENGAVTVNGMGGDDTLIGGNGWQNNLSGGDGNDVIVGGTGPYQYIDGGNGDDTIKLGATNQDYSDYDFFSIHGGDGTDTLILNGGYPSSSYVWDIQGIELIRFTAGHSYDVEGVQLPAGQSLIVDGSGLAASDSLTFQGMGSGEVKITSGAGNDVLTPGAGNDTVSAGAGDDTISLYSGGDDVISGGDGNDVFLADILAAETTGYSSADQITGGHGNDTLEFSADATAYGSGIELGANIKSIETIIVDVSGSIDITVADRAVQSGKTMTIDASAYTVSGLMFDGSAESNGRFIIHGSHLDDVIADGAGNDVVYTDTGNNTVISHGGNDTYFGSTGNDLFEMGGYFSAMDRIDGEYGADIVELDGDYSAGVVMKATTMQNVSGMLLDAGHSYSLATNDGNVAVGGSLQIDGSALGGGDVLRFDGHAESDGALDIRSGAGDDSLVGGGGGDLINGGAGSDLITGRLGQDTLTGGTGADRFIFLKTLDSQPGSGHRDMILDFSHSDSDLIDLHKIDADVTQSGNQAFHLAGDAFTGAAGELIQYVDQNGHTIVAGDVNGDSVADFEIQLNGAPSLVAGDFVL